MFTDEDVLQSELTSLRNKIKVFEEILIDYKIKVLDESPFIFPEDTINEIRAKYKMHFNL